VPDTPDTFRGPCLHMYPPTLLTPYPPSPHTPPPPTIFQHHLRTTRAAPPPPRQNPHTSSSSRGPPFRGATPDTAISPASRFVARGLGYRGLVQPRRRKPPAPVRPAVPQGQRGPQNGQRPGAGTSIASSPAHHWTSRAGERPTPTPMAPLIGQGESTAQGLPPGPAARPYLPRGPRKGRTTRTQGKAGSAYTVSNGIRSLPDVPGGGRSMSRERSESF